MPKSQFQILMQFASAVLFVASTWTAHAQEAKIAQDPPLKISEAGLRMLSDEVAGYAQRDLTVGAELIVIQADKVLLHKSYGFSDRDSKTNWKNDTVCNIRSMTKAFTSAAAQILIDRGKLKIDAPVADYLPSFDTDATRAITVRHVLSHRSGLPLTTLQSPKQFSSLAEQVSASAQAELLFEPGTKFWYSDAGTDVVAAIVETVAGESIDQFVTREILQPLGMEHSFYGFDSSHPQFSEIATMYLGGPKNWSPFWKPANEPFYPFAWGSQTLYSTTSDYTKFLGLILDHGTVGERRVLSADAIGRMTEPASVMSAMGSDKPMPTGFSGLQTFYGHMLVTYRTDAQGPIVALGHSGSDGTIAWAWPKHDLVIAYFTQSRGGRTPLRMEAAIDRILFQGAADIEIPERLKPYQGNFVANFARFKDEIFTVSAKGNKLYLDIPSQMDFELIEPDYGELWAFAVAPEQVQVEFVRDNQGEVMALRMHQGGHVYEVPRTNNAVKIPEATETADDEMKDLPTAEWIITKFVEVTGGSEAYEAATSMIGKGSVSIPRAGIKGSINFTYAKGNKWLIETQLGAAGTERSGSDGEVAWAQAGTSEARTLEGSELAQAQQEADLQARLHPQQYYSTMKTTGVEPIEGEECYRVELSSAADDDATIEYFSVKTGYLLRRISKVDAPIGKVQIIEDFSDYRATGKRFTWHKSVKHLPGNIAVVIELEKVQFNESVDDIDFSMQ